MNDIRMIPKIFSENNVFQRRNQTFDVQIWTSYLKITKWYDLYMGNHAAIKHQKQN